MPIVSRMYIGPFSGSNGESDANSTRSAPEETKTAYRGVVRSEQGRVGVKHPEVVDRTLLESLQHHREVLVRRARPQLVPSGSQATLAVRRHRAHVMRDDREVRKSIEEAVEHDARHGRAGLVRASRTSTRFRTTSESRSNSPRSPSPGTDGARSADRSRPSPRRAAGTRERRSVCRARCYTAGCREHPGRGWRGRFPAAAASGSLSGSEAMKPGKRSG